MTRVIHTGDTHIGYQQYNSPARRRDFLAAFDQVADDAIEADVDAVVHAGDLFHDRRPGLVDLQGTVGILRSLADAEIPFLAIVGNHEGKRDAQWLDLFADLGLATRLGERPVVIDDVAFYGLDFVPRSRRDDLAYEFEAIPETADHAALVSHGLFEPFAHADWETETVLAESSVSFDAMLLGDNHTPDTAEVRDSWVTYCGSTERASASERDPRGYNLVTFDDEVAITRRGLPDTREFVFVDCDLEPGEGGARVQERLAQYDVDDAVVVVTLEGEGEPVTPAAIEERARERGAVVARVNDRRELPDTEADVSVSFADPDAAVTERLRELGLSTAAREIDETVRDDGVVDTNVRETVERRVRELMESDEAAFEPVEEAPSSGPERPEREDDSLESTEAGANVAAETGEQQSSDVAPDAVDVAAEPASSDSEQPDAAAPSDSDAQAVADQSGGGAAVDGSDEKSDATDGHRTLGEFE